MTDDNGNHAATPVEWVAGQRRRDREAAERDRLKAINAELVEALEDIWRSRRHGEAMAIARTVLDKAKEG